MAKKKVAKNKSATFEESLALVEEVVGKLEGGQLDLAESLDAYEQGVKRLKACYRMLDDAERRIELVTAVDQAGSTETEPFDDSASDENTDRSKQRSRTSPAKSAAKRPASDEVDDASSLF